MSGQQIQSLQDYSLYCAGRLANPYPLFHQLSVEDPVHWSEELESWIITRYDDVSAGLRDPRLLSDRIAASMAALSESQRSKVEPLGEHISNWLGFTDAPKHTRLRRLISGVFTPKLAEDMRGRIQEITNELLDNLEKQKEVDLISDYAFPLPATVICEILGIDSDRQEQFRIWAEDIGAFAGGVGSSLERVAAQANASRAELTRYFRELSLQRRSEPRDDLITKLALVEEQGERLTEQELLGLCVFLFAAGHETTLSLVGNALFVLMQNRSERTRLVNDWGLTESAIEETLRYESPIQIITRVAGQDLELRGRSVHKGQQLILVLGAANRDPEQFSEPDRYDIGRKHNKHIAFGWGIHFCLGAPLARVEGQIAVKSLLSRFPNVRLYGNDFRWLESMSLRRLESLPAVLV